MSNEKKMRIRTAYNRKESDTRKEVSNKPSKTRPDESLTMREILDRYAHGQSIPGGRVGDFDNLSGDDTDFDGYPDPETLDFAEREIVEALIKEELADYDKKTTEYNKWLAEKKKKDEEDAQMAAFEKASEKMSAKQKAADSSTKNT